MTDWVLVAYVIGALLTWNSLEHSAMAKKVSPAFYAATVAAWPAVWVLGVVAGLIYVAQRIARGGGQGKPPEPPSGQTEG